MSLSRWTRRNRGGQTATERPDRSALAAANAALATPTDTRREPVVAVLLATAVENMSRRFREDVAVAAALRTSEEVQARLDGPPGQGAGGSDGLSGGLGLGRGADPTATGRPAPVGRSAVDVATAAAEIEEVRAARVRRHARAELAVAEQTRQTAEREVVDALVTIARSAQTEANSYLAALNAARSDLGRGPLALLEDDVIDELFTRAVRQPGPTETTNEEA